MAYITYRHTIATCPSSSSHCSTAISNSLTTCTHVFVWHYAICKPLQHPYDDPYKVLKRTPLTTSFFSISYTPPSNIQPTPEPNTASPASPPQVTHSGQHVRWPDCFYYWKLAFSLVGEYLWHTVHRHTQCCTLHSSGVCYFSFYVKSHGVYIGLYFLVFVMWVSTLLTIHFSILLVCALHECSSW